MADNAPNKIIRECDLLLDGSVVKTQEQMNRWMIVQIKKLAIQSSSRKVEHQRLQNKLLRTDKFTKGGL